MLRWHLLLVIVLKYFIKSFRRNFFSPFPIAIFLGTYLGARVIMVLELLTYNYIVFLIKYTYLHNFFTHVEYADNNN